MKRHLTFIFALVFLILFSLGNVSAAHFIIGKVNNAVNGVSANGRTIVLWNPTYGISDNLTDIIGSSGNSGVNNTYMIDCQLLSNPCAVGDNLSLKVVSSQDGYNSGNVSVTVTGAGYDIAPNITLNAPPNISFLNITQPIPFVPGQINLIAASEANVSCTAIVKDPEGGPLYNLTARLFDSNSTYDSPNDNNSHYANSSCWTNSSYTSPDNSSEVVCGFRVWYYANPGNWICTFHAQDNLSASSNSSATAKVNQLLSVGLNSTINFGTVNGFNVSNEIKANVINYGNVKLNLSLYGYANTEGDGYAMECALGKKIPLYYERFNLTNPNPGNLNLSEMEFDYKNLTSNYTVYKFDLPKRTDNFTNNAINSTYWRIFVPQGTGGNCTGNIIFGASIAPGV